MRTLEPPRPRRAFSGAPPVPRPHAGLTRPGRAYPATTAEGHDFSRVPVHPHPARIFPRLAASTPGDASEREADRVAGEVTADTAERRDGLCEGCGGAPSAHPRPALQRAASGAGLPVPAGVAAQIGTLNGRGRALDGGARQALEPRFGFDFGRVRVHNDARAGQMAREVGARAFTVGTDIAFAPGEYAPATAAGRRLLAHELAHVVQQGGTGPRLQRTPAATAAPDPLCASFSFATKKAQIQAHIDALKAAPDVETRLKLIQELKWIRRCGSQTETAEITAALEAGLGVTEAAAVWAESGKAFGGYRGMYPGYYSGAKARVTGLGATEVSSFGAFSYDPRSSDASTFAPKAEAAATAEAADVEATDLLYFYGHQYAQYDAPGVFANGTQTRFIDLRSLAAKGNFGRVKLMVSTSCATICKEAVDVFAPLFPNAVILGYRKSAPIEGNAVRNSFDTAIAGLKKPLLLDQPVDVDAIIGVWKSVMEKHHPNEAERLPGYYQGGTVHYLENGVWKSMPASDPANTCKKKGSRLEEAAH